MGKRWIAIGAVVLIAGIMLFMAGMKNLSWDFSMLNTAEYETNTYAIEEVFSDISVSAETANVTFEISKDGSCTVECREPKNAKHRVSVDSGVLNIWWVDERAWYEHIGIFFSSMKVTVYLPEEQYGKLSVTTATGAVSVPGPLQFEDVALASDTGAVFCGASASGEIKLKCVTGAVRGEDISAKSLSVTVSTGRTELKNIRCETLKAKGDTGSVRLENVVATGLLSVERDTGNVELVSCDGAEIFIETDTGDITGTLLTEKVFVANSDTGRVEVPKTGTGGTCKLDTDTGDIKVTVEK